MNLVGLQGARYTVHDQLIEQHSMWQLVFMIHVVQQKTVIDVGSACLRPQVGLTEIALTDDRIRQSHDQ